MGVRSWTLVIVLAASVASVFGCGGEEEDSASLQDVAAKLQSSVAFDYTPLSETGTSLEQVSRQADVAGIGRIIDVRPAYSLRYSGGEPTDVQHMLIVIKPERLVAGEGKLGSSGLVFLDQTAPAQNIQTDDSPTDPIDDVRRDAVASTERVAFLLSIEPEPEAQERIDEGSGRASDDPLLWPTVPSSVLAVDEEQGVAYPLLTGEQIENRPDNLSVLEQLGARVEGFVTAGDRSFVSTGSQP